jgi:hypothetical protein
MEGRWGSSKVARARGGGAEKAEKGMHTRADGSTASHYDMRKRLFGEAEIQIRMGSDHDTTEPERRRPVRL